jgi:hypothetical protein
MAAFDPGAGGTLKSTTLEGIAMEAALLLQNAERAAIAATPEAFPNNIAVSFFTGDNVIQVQAALPLSADFSNDGKVTFSAVDYLGSPFTTDGDLKATTLPQAVLELFQRLQNTEKSQPDAGDKVQLSYATETNIATINAEFPITFSVAPDGTISVSANPYLA